MRIDDLSAPSGRFVARVTAAVTTDDCRPGRGDNFPAADTAFASVFTVPSGGGTGSADAPAAAKSVTQHAPPTSSTSQGADSAEIADPAASAPSLQGDPPTALPLRVAFPLGFAEEQSPPLAPSHLLLIMASGPAGPLAHPLDVLSPRRESHGRDHLWPSLRPPLLSPRQP